MAHRDGWTATRPLVALLFAVLALSGCQGVKDTLGLTKKSPDEFAVVTNVPLVVPPDYKLRPPDPGAPRPQDTTVREKAQAALVGQPSASLLATPRSSGETALLTQAQAVNPDPGIRRKVNDEFTQLTERDHSFVDRLIFWQKAQPPGTVIDPDREAQRIRETSASGQNPTGNDVPTVKRRERGILEGIF